ncbi:MAG: hypothetical protein LQ343_000922 [Gyalolechia ehrenbergii]|nr:MAG: hypothetical protein LQ343_000922 [Gyalolechia ehrenbergii]
MASNLVFINTSGPDDSKSDAKRKAVRSQAAKDHSTSSSNKPEGAGRRRHRKLLSVEIDLDVYGSDASGGSGSPPTLAESSAVAPEVPSNLDRTEPPSTGNDLDPVERTLTKLGLTSPFVPYPENQIAPAMLSHYISEVAVDIPELDHPGAQGSLRSVWFPMVITAQATLYITILFAASHYLSVRQTRCKPEVLYQLKEEAIAAINRALRDPKLAISDQVIAAVAKIAAYEAGFAGDEEQYHIHMRGLTKMVELRGGLESLELDGLLARMLLFIDLNAAFLLKTKLYFPHANAL